MKKQIIPFLPSTASELQVNKSSFKFVQVQYVKMTNVLMRLLINKVNRMKKRCLKVAGWKGRPLEKLKRSGKEFIYGKIIEEAEFV
jgi:hypothetical protein